MGLQSFISKVGPVVSADLANQLDRLANYQLVGVDSGVVNAYVIALPVSTDSFVRTAGSIVRFTTANTSTGAATLNVAGTGVAAVLGQSGAASVGGEISSAVVNVAQWTGTAWKTLGSGISPNYDITAAEVAAGVTPVNFAVPNHNAIGVLLLERYGINTTPGTTDMSTALQNAINIAMAARSSGDYGIPIRFLANAYSIVTPPTFGSVTTAMIPLDIGGVGIASQIINNAGANKPTFDMSGKDGWYLHDFLSCGNSAHKNDSIRAGSIGGTLQIRWRIERVISMIPGVGFYVADTNGGVINNCRSWPNNPPVLQVPQTVVTADISHHCYLTGGFVNLVSIYDCDFLPSVNYAANQRGIKLDATASSGVSIIGGDFESNGAANVETGIDVSSAGSVQNLTIQGVYHEGTAISLTNVSFSCIGPMTNGTVGGSLVLNAGTRNNLFMGVSVVTINESSSGNYGNTFVGCNATTTWTDNSGTSTNPPDRRINCLQAGALINDYGGGQSFNVPYSASMTPDTFNGLQQRIVAINGTAFTINAPLHPIIGQRIRLQIYNASGGALGAVTFNAVYKMSAWTQPANGFNRSVELYYDSVAWCQVSQTGVDVPT